MADLSAFHDVLFPLAVSFGATGGPERRNEIVRTLSGREIRNARFERSRRRYDAGTGLRSIDDIHEVMAFFEARRGSLHGFRFRDPFETRSCAPGAEVSPLDQALGIGDGEASVFSLAKTYGEGDEAYVRPITRPVAGSVRVAVDGAEVDGATDFSVDASTGQVAFTVPPAMDAVLTAGFEFHVPVRFDTDRIEASLASFRAGQIPAIPLVEIAA